MRFILLPFLFRVVFSCLQVSENKDVMRYTLINVTANTEKLIRSSMSDVERFSGNVLVFEEDDSNPCIIISLSELEHDILGRVFHNHEMIHMVLKEKLFLSNASDIGKQNVIFHELGHVFDLMHTNSTSDIMFPHPNNNQQLASFAKSIKRQFSKKIRKRRLRHTMRGLLRPVDRIVNASIIPTSFADCLKNSKIVSFSFSKTFFDFKFSRHIREIIDVSQKFIEIISPLRFKEVDSAISRSCIEYSFDDHPHCDFTELFSFPSVHIPKRKPKDFEFMIHIINYLKKSEKKVVFHPILKLLPNIERDCVDFNEFHSDGAEYSPIVFFFFTFFTKVLGFVPRYDGFHHFLDPTSMFHDDIFINNSFGDFTLLIKAIDTYIKNSN